MKDAQLDLGFKVTEAESGVMRISVKSAGLGIGGMVLFGILSLIVSVPVGSAIGVALFGGNTNILISILTVSAGIVYLVNLLKSRTYEFEISDSAVTKDGVNYAIENISEVFVDNGHHKKGHAIVSAGGFAVGGSSVADTTLAGTMAIANTGAAALFNASASAGAKVNYRVNIRHGRKVVALAKNLDEGTAISLFQFLTSDN